MREHFDVLLVGAGLYNAVLANRFANHGLSCLIVEKRNEIGGNCHTYELNGITVHKYGAHIFHTSNDEVWKFANRFANFVPYQNSPIAMTKKDGKFLYLNLPFNMNTYARIWPDLSPEEISAKIDEEIDEAKATEDTFTLSGCCKRMVGKTVFELLVKDYTEKQWGKPCEELPPDLIKRLPMRFTWNNNYFNDKYQGIPEEGYTKWIENMIFRDAPSKVNLLLGVDYLERRTELSLMANHVFYSGRPDLLYEQHDLPFRSLKFETSVLPIPDFQGTAVVNHNTKDVPYTRTIEHKHFQPWKEGTEMCVPRSMTTVVTTETPCLCNKADDEPYYPINSQENERIYRGYADVAKDSRIHLCGRLGLYRYLDMDDCIESALNMADEWCAKM
jgi:UDP-galactopyranose mutase